MEILLTRQFLTEARRDPVAVTSQIEHLLRVPASPGPCASVITGGRLLGWAKRADQLELLALRKDEPVDSEYPLADMSRAELIDLGVPDEIIKRAQQVRVAADLEPLALPQPVLQRLRFRILQKGLGDPLHLERRADSLGHLEQFLRGEITELLLNLDATQRPIVNLPVPGPILVRGVAGSGKTAVALHRIHALMCSGSRLSPPRILYLTFNKALASASAELLQSLGVKPGAVEVMNIHRWCKEYLGAAMPRKIIQGDERSELLVRARAQVQKSTRSSALWRYPDTFWDEEIHRIDGQVLKGRNEYLSMTRYGADRPLDARLRELVWEVREAYRGLCASRRAVGWDEITRLAHEKLVGTLPSLQAYDHVFVDEAQDFTVVALRIAAALAGAPANLMISFDPAQSIYEKGFRWKSCGIPAHGSRSFALLKNHRSSRQILEFARPLLDIIRSDPSEADGGGREDLIDPVAGDRTGDTPQVIRAPARQEAEHVAALIKAALERDRVPPQNIAVLTFKRFKRARIVAALEAAGVLCQAHDGSSEVRLAEASVKVFTMHAAKGLEFPVVFLAVSARDLKVPKVLSDPADAAGFLARTRKVVYTAMTRALTRLTIVHDEADGSPLDALLSPWTLPAGARLVPAAAPKEPAAAVHQPVFAQGYTRFHREICEHLGSTAKKARFASREEAIRNGLKPCRSCRP